MVSELTLANLVGIAMIFILGILGMRLFRKTILQLLSFLIPMLVAAALAGYIDLVQSTIALIFVIVLFVIALFVALVYKLIRAVVERVDQRVGY
mgnify:CR=1 FL=1